MSIAIDLSAIAVAGFCVATNELKPDETMEPQTIKHMTLNSMARIIRKFKKEWGEGGIWICCDSQGKTWRKEIFPHYKASRAKNKAKSPYNWELYYSTIHEFVSELQAHFPYHTLGIPRAEADDIFAGLVAEHKGKHPVLIVSGDTDLYQLCSDVHPKIKMYTPIRDTFVNPGLPPHLYLKELFIRGDVGDGLANFKSHPKTLITEGMRQVPLKTKDVERWIHQDPSEFCLTEEQTAGYQRNKTLIDFECIPADLMQQIRATVAASKPLGTMDDVKTYLIKNNLSQIYERIDDLSPGNGTPATARSFDAYMKATKGFGNRI